QRGGEAGPGEADDEARILELAMGEEGGAEGVALLLRVLQDDELGAGGDRRDGGADAEGWGLAAGGAGWRGGGIPPTPALPHKGGGGSKRGGRDSGRSLLL